MAVKDKRKDIETCFGTSCNFCERNCPVFRQLRVRTYTSRGKNRAMLGMIDGHYDATKKMSDVVYTCTLCGACDVHCALENTERFIELRRELVKKGLARPEYKDAVQRIKDKGDVYGRNIDIKALADETKDGDMPMFLGCQYKGNESEVRNIVKVLRKMGVKPKIVAGEACCGYIADIMGYEGDVADIVGRFKKAFPHTKFITLCPSCTLFTEKAMGLQPVHVMKYVHELIKSGKVKLNKLDMTVTYHDPCDLGRRLKIVDEPRAILKAMGVKLVEMENSGLFSMCCGAGGGMLITNPDLVEKMATQRMKQAIDTGAEVLVTACPTCESTLLTGSMLAKKEFKKKIKVKSIWELLDKALA